MLKSTLVIVLIVGTCFADIASWNSDRTEFNFNNNLDNIKGLHYSQHEASVNAARKGAAERLARISGGSGGTLCGTACSGFSDSSDTETLGQGIVGFTSGSTGSGSSSAKYQAASTNYEAAAVYPVAEASKSSYSHSSQRHSSSRVGSGANYIAATDGLKTRSSYGGDIEAAAVQPIVVSAYPIGQESAHSSYSGLNRESSSGVYTVPVDSSGSYRTRTSYTSASGRDSSSVVQPTVPVYTSGDHSSKYAASEHDNYQRYTPVNTYVVYRKPVPVYTPVSSNLESSVRFSNPDNAAYTPGKVVYPARTSSSQYSAAEEQQSFSAVAGQPQPVYSSSSSDRAAQSASNYRSSTGYRPVYQPIYTNHLASSDRADEYQSRLTENVAPVGVVSAPTISSSSNRHDERHEDYSRKGSVYVPVVSSGASKYSSHDQRQINTGASYVPIVPVGGSTSETSSKYAAHEQQKSSSAYVPVVVQPAGSSSSSSSSQYSAQEHQQQQLARGTYYPVSNAGYGSRYSAHDAQHAYRQQQVGKGGSYVPYPITDDALGRRFGASGSELGANSDLGGLMSETERLAKLQAKNAYNGAVSGSSAIDTENRFSGSSDGASNDNSLGGGFQRTKSWSSSSKWASGQKYGDDGKIKSYSSLSTAESEQHNINGKKTGYKAATSTLEDDGKVSTYSLHTP